MQEPLVAMSNITDWAAAVYKGKLFVCCGYDNKLDRPISSVFISDNGVNFAKLADGPFAARQRPILCVLGGRLWLVGGWKSGTFFQDTWWTEDGVNWTQGPDMPATHVFSHHRLAVTFGGSLVLLPATRNNRRVCVMASDGTWTTPVTELLPYASFPAHANPDQNVTERVFSKMCVFEGELWVYCIAKVGDDTSLLGWYTSPDGASWSFTQFDGKFFTLENVISNYALIDSAYPLWVKHGKMWILGPPWGGPTGKAIELYSSSDGFSWAGVTVGENKKGYYTAYNNYEYYGVAVLDYGPRTYVLNGYNSLHGATKHYWSSQDMLQWGLSTPTLPPDAARIYLRELPWKLALQVMHNLYYAQQIYNWTEIDVLGCMHITDGSVDWNLLQTLIAEFVPADILLNFMTNFQLYYNFYAIQAYAFVTANGFELLTGTYVGLPTVVTPVELSAAVEGRVSTSTEVELQVAVEGAVKPSEEVVVTGTCVLRVSNLITDTVGATKQNLLVPFESAIHV